MSKKRQKKEEEEEEDPFGFQERRVLNSEKTCEPQVHETDRGNRLEWMKEMK